MGESRPLDSPCCDYAHHPLWFVCMLLCRAGILCSHTAISPSSNKQLSLCVVWRVAHTQQKTATVSKLNSASHAKLPPQIVQSLVPVFLLLFPTTSLCVFRVVVANVLRCISLPHASIALASSWQLHHWGPSVLPLVGVTCLVSHQLAWKSIISCMCSVMWCVLATTGKLGHVWVGYCLETAVMFTWQGRVVSL